MNRVTKDRIVYSGGSDARTTREIARYPDARRGKDLFNDPRHRMLARDRSATARPHGWKYQRRF